LLPISMKIEYQHDCKEMAISAAGIQVP
jgi:hypothetical protein